MCALFTSVASPEDIYLQAGDPQLGDPTPSVCYDSASGTVAHDRVVQQVTACFVSPPEMLENVDGEDEVFSCSVDSAEDKKAEGAS